MKVAIVSTKDWNESECMLPARHLNYTADDFKDMDRISKEWTKVESEKDPRNICPRVIICTIKKCNIKQAIIDNKELIMSNIVKAAQQELQRIIESTDGRFEKIEKTLEVK